MPRPANPSTRSKLLKAAFAVIRAKGYAATTVDDICAESGLSKGFFCYTSSAARKPLPSAPRSTAVANDGRVL